MALEIIGAGFGRIGTESMRRALNMLGFGPCHHMFEVNDNPVMKARWRAFMDDDSAPDWDASSKATAPAWTGPPPITGATS
jgi:hypothetical protein